MAEDVIDSLENMKITADEEVIAILDDGRMEAIANCNLSLIGKFLTCISFNKRAAKNTLIRRAWGLEDKMQTLEIGPNLFQFNFQLEFDMT